MQCIHMHVYNPGDLLFEGHVGVLVGVARPVSSRPLLLLPLPTLPFVIWGTKRILAIDREREDIDRVIDRWIYIDINIYMES